VPIFAEQRYNDINPSYTDIIPINKSGTYFLSGNCEFYHIKNRYENNSNAPMKIKAPEQAGTYLGIAEKDGNFVLPPVKLAVTAGDPTSIHLDTANSTVPNLSFEVKLEMQDRFGNFVENNTAAAIVEFDNAKENVTLFNGRGSINLTAPEKTGIYKIKAQSRYGISEKILKLLTKSLLKLVIPALTAQELKRRWIR